MSFDVTRTQPPADPDATRTRGEAGARFDGPVDVPGYTIHEPLGEGGMGVVYRATHLKLHRTVALKMVLGGGSRERVRFLAEAEAIAAIDHPHVVRIFDTGEAGGRPYLAMECLTGGSLAARLKEGRSAPREAAELVRKLALAVQAAHDRQIVHRDLKPSNILFDTAGEPRVTDFGLAKKSGAGDLTNSNAIMGTAAYMAPEQARGESKFVGPAADVWALGVILYECLSGQRPFTGSNEIDIIRQVVDAEPSSVRSHVGDIPKDLDLIAHKCLVKDPAGRYASAADLAEDLRRWLHSEPVSVKAAGPLERTAKWVRRNKLAAGIMAASLLGLVVASSLAVLAWSQSRRAELAEQYHAEESARANQQTIAAQKARQEAQNEALRANDNTIAAKEATARANTERAKAEKQLDRAERLIYANDLQAAARHWNDANAVAARDRLTDTRWDFRGWEFNHLWRKFHHNQRKLELTGSVNAVDWSGDGRWLVTADGHNDAVIWNATNGKSVHTLKHPAGVTAVAFLGDGSRLVTACGDNNGRIWDTGSGKPIRELLGHEKPVQIVVASPDGRTILTGSQDGTACVWDADSGVCRQTVQAETSSFIKEMPRHVAALAISPDGRLGAMICGSYILKTFDLATGKTRMKNPIALGAMSVAFTNDSQSVLMGTSLGHIEVWNATTLDQRAVLGNMATPVAAVAASRDGRSILAGCWDSNVRVLNATDGAVQETFVGHSSYITSLAQSPDGRQLISGGQDKAAIIWDLASPPDTRDFRFANGPGVHWAAPGAQSERLLSVTGRELKTWNVVTGKLEGAVAFEDSFRNPLLSADGRLLAGTSYSDFVVLTDAATGRSRGRLAVEGVRLKLLAVNADGSRVLTGYEAGQIGVWDAATQKLLLTLRGHGEWGTCGVFSIDGRRFATGGSDKVARIWQTDTAQPVAELKGHTEAVTCVAFDAAGERIASGSFDHTARVWNATTGAPVYSLRGHTQRILSVAFSPDGRRILTASADNTLRIWDAESGTFLFELAWPPPNNTLALPNVSIGFATAYWSADGRFILGINTSGIVRIWSAGHGPSLLELKGHTGPVVSVGIMGSPQELVTEQKDKTVRAFDPKSGRPIDAKREFLPGATDGKFHFTLFEGKPYVWLDAIEKVEEQENARLWSESAKPNPAWHRKLAREAEQAEDWFAAAFHLRWLVKLEPEIASFKERLKEAGRHLAREPAPPPRR